MNRLESARREVDSLCDRLGKPLDEKIKELVIGLRCHGIRTIASCQGHLDHGLPYPWVDVEKHYLGILLKWVARENRPNLPNGKKNLNTWVIKPVAGSYRLIPEDKNLPLEEMQEKAEEFGFFLKHCRAK